MTVDELVKSMNRLGVAGVALFRAKISSNKKVPEVVDDLLFEGIAAIVLTRAGFVVEMRESPDLALAYNGDRLFAEVKHFRRKAQDKLDDLRLREAIKQGRLVAYGDTLATEERSASQQVIDVLRKKARRLPRGERSIIVVGSSSSHCVDDLAVQMAVARLEDRQVAVASMETSRLNGVLYLSPDYNAGQRRSAYYYSNSRAASQLGAAVQERLNGIRVWQADL